jgi:hypothetical protein
MSNEKKSLNPAASAAAKALVICAESVAAKGGGGRGNVDQRTTWRERRGRREAVLSCPTFIALLTRRRREVEA